MPSIGPQLPTSPPKRKRSSSPPKHTSLPPAKQARASNNADEIDLSDSNSDSSFGPPAPPSTTTAPIKPCPPAKPDSTSLPADSDSSDSDSYGPSLPTATSKRPTIGPSLPATDPAPQRDTWMLAPPSSSGYTERDPTRMRNRKFTSKPATTSSAPSSIWTETPEEKLKRQRDALLGRTTEASADGGSASQRTKHQEERDRKIAATIDAHRGKSLYDEHSRKRRDDGAKNGRAAHDDDDDDDPSKRAFDREKDMAVGGKIGEKARRELINKSANFGGRFQKGSFL
ncbi:DUF3752 domain protein [Metarhizium robertsii]|uniref:DUF3752 domain-containing protein n=2 Tax=Metarhizium robertsii TaxID=568076 RepID=E9EMJ1_METRA|nr:uncharacterized protein MAA_00698 [Metarhizium robertsii ARSEF 23]EFZ03624.1 hypothetical protein MAA_00698 [Metarhizium robertsii ARSEF 23]EXV01984.1 DUF3752 domain protein [Metarhizium robertsii]